MKKVFLPIFFCVGVTAGVLVEKYWSVPTISDTTGLAGGQTCFIPNLADTLKTSEGWPRWMDDRRKYEASFKHDELGGFQFSDRANSLGITFYNAATLEGGREYKAVHYDHGSGVSAADVNGDGWIDLFFVAQRGGNELWLNDHGVFHKAPPGDFTLSDRVNVSAGFADLNGDGAPDLVLTSVRKGTTILFNDGRGNFHKVAEVPGGHEAGVSFADLDRDGKLEILVTNVGRYTSDKPRADGTYPGFADAFEGHLHPDRYEKLQILRQNSRGEFVDIAANLGVSNHSWTGEIIPWDYDGDGWVDLYLLNMQGEDLVYHNIGGTHFELVVPPGMEKTPWGSMGAALADFNGDEKQDLFIADMHSDMFEVLDGEDYRLEGLDLRKVRKARIPPQFFFNGTTNNIFGNALFLSSGSGFIQRAEDWNAETYWPWGASAADLNADGRPDLIITQSMNYTFRYQPNQILMNDNGQKFIPFAFRLGIEPRLREGPTKPWFELDCRGEDQNREECVLCLQHPKENPGCRMRSDGKLVIYGSRGSRSSVVADFDNDGDLDIITNEFNDSPQALLSNLSQVRDIHYFKLELLPKRGDQTPFGTEVTITSGKKSQTQVFQSHSGYLSSSILPLYFGLGSGTQVDRIRIRWSTGETQSFTGPWPANKTAVIRSGENEVHTK